MSHNKCWITFVVKFLKVWIINAWNQLKEVVILRTYNLHVENINCNEINISSQNYLFSLYNIWVLATPSDMILSGNIIVVTTGSLPWGLLLAFEVSFPRKNRFSTLTIFIIYQIGIELKNCSSEQIMYPQRPEGGWSVMTLVHAVSSSLLNLLPKWPIDIVKTTCFMSGYYLIPHNIGFNVM